MYTQKIALLTLFYFVVVEVMLQSQSATFWLQFYDKEKLVKMKKNPFIVHTKSPSKFKKKT